ncbi:hypothetical protein DFQ14_10595 [Halopolyspora algeriensis]|uniref:DUF5709 domain-containing protein n=1 Tax=Halopolyspora algeriensis TaxID=1500506 RepID=A0A368VQL8_9ACTN|nr:hypothetical protein [Halopolyspora algeriensis]RCW43950.1 hypothetical protein DFQ14_10595 [Halopolyspora algeriensis]TQM53547.1 hypothetical protein FHU43_1704 [Halopolyspora algeriensis]
MSDPLEGTTPSANEVEPDSGDPEDPNNLQSAQNLDEDELAVDPLEEGVEPSEHWSTIAEERPTPREQREGETLDRRLAEERPDTPTGGTERPLTETRMQELDESVDERAAAEVADEGDEEEAAARPVEADHGAVLEGEEVEPTGRSAMTREGADAIDEGASGRMPEEDAERIEDSGR